MIETAIHEVSSVKIEPIKKLDSDGIPFYVRDIIIKGAYDEIVIKVFSNTALNIQAEVKI